MKPSEVEERLKTLVDPGQASVCVKGVRTVQGGVLVETQSGKDLQFFRESEALRVGGLVVSEPEAPRRKVGVFDIPAGSTEEAVMAALQSQVFPLMGAGDFRAAVRVARKSEGKREGSRGAHWVLEAAPEIAEGLVKRGRVFLGWSSCVVRDYVEAGRCFRCLCFGHTARSCPRQAMTCGWCAGDGHPAAECPAKSRPPCCVNCRGAGLSSTHGTLDGACPFYRAMLDREKAVAVEKRAAAAAREKREIAAKAVMEVEPATEGPASGALAAPAPAGEDA